MLPAQTDLILVAVLPTPRDFEIARLLGWYRIPLRTAPKLLSVDFIAFYQTAAFGDQAGRIQYVAPVRGHELTTRRLLLRDEPHHPRASEEYFKMQLGEMIHLPSPVCAHKWKRFSFFYTTGAYLNRAEVIEDLVIRSEDRTFVWQSLRERAARMSDYRPADWPEALDPALLDALLWKA